MEERRASSTDTIMLEAYADRLWESVETHQLSDAAVAALTDLVVDCTSTGIILRANESFCAFAGLPLEEIEGRDSHEFAFLQNRDTPRCTLELTARDGMRTWFDRLQLSMRDPHSGNHFVRVVGRDVTDHKLSELALIEARERAEEADAAKSRFLAMVSHEIRTPLNGIIGMGKLMSDTKLSAEQQNYIEAITTSGEALLVLVNDLLQFGRHELTQDTLKNEATDIRLLVAGVMELLAEKAHGIGLDLGYRMDETVPEKVSVDAGRLRQILFNVIGNGVKFTKCGGVRLDVSYEDDAQLVMRITDTGDGISPEDRARIFEPFEQVEDTFTRAHDGAGLGLAISRRMAEVMGGDIHLKSATGQGSTFTIRISARKLKAATIETDSLAGANFILISESGIETDVMCETVRAAGGIIEMVETIEAARALIRTQKITTKIIIRNHLIGDEPVLESDFWPYPCQLIALITPEERGTLGAEFQASGHAFLTRPVRPSTCLRVLSDRKTDTQDDPLATEISQLTKSNGTRVLLAEDNPINALLAQRLLERDGYVVTHVENGQAALDAVRDEHYDFVLMDFHMPVMDGVSAIKAIRNLEEGDGRTPVPIFMVTADSGDEIVSTALAAGATAILEKPLCIEMFQGALAALHLEVA